MERTQPGASQVKTTHENPLRILVADNWGQMPHPYMHRKFPNCTFKVHTVAVSTHPHGHMVAECVLDMLPKSAHVELTFYPHLTLQTRSPNGWLDVIKEAADAGKPFHACNCSFGSSHGDDDLTRAFLDARYNFRSKEYAKAKDALNGIPTIVTFASGNSDDLDEDNDVNYPQRHFSQLDRVFVIGACAADTVPSAFSSDGEEVFAMYWGETVPVYDPVTGRNTYVDGTSFASPFACGDLCRMLLADEEVTKTSYLNRILRLGWVKKGWERGRQDRKAGYGCMIPVQKEVLPFDKASRLADPAKLLGVEVTYLDFEPTKKKYKPPFWRRRPWRGPR